MTRTCIHVCIVVMLIFIDILFILDSDLHNRIQNFNTKKTNQSDGKGT